jgi:hypothetical protein
MTNWKRIKSMEGIGEERLEYLEQTRASSRRMVQNAE